MEIILDSIKRVIARENRATLGRNGRGSVVTEYEPEPDDRLDIEPADAEEAAEVLQLDEDEIIAHAPAPAAMDGHLYEPARQEDDMEEDLNAHGWAEPEGLGEADQQFYPAAAYPADEDAEPLDLDRAHEAPEQPLTSEETRAAMRENLAALSVLSTLARGQAEGGGPLSIEGMARDMLRPLLAEWLDANLPPLVERLVQAEIARIMTGEG